MTLFILTIVIITLLVALRLVLLWLKYQSDAQVKKAPTTIEGKSAVLEPAELAGLWFDNFESEDGPEDKLDFFERMWVTAQMPGAQRMSRFHLYLTTPQGLESYMKKNNVGHLFGRDLLVVERYDIEAIRAAVEKRIDDLPHIAEQTS